MEPPQNFVYLYRNHLKEAQQEAVARLGIQLKTHMEEASGHRKRRLWRSFLLAGDRDYHNGMSYLLEGRLQDVKDEQMYCEALCFLENFRLYRAGGCVEYLYTY